MNRVDLANNKLKEMKISAEEHALTRIAAAWIAYVEGDKTKLQNAVYTYEELIDKYCKYCIICTPNSHCTHMRITLNVCVAASAQLLNGQAIGEMHLGNYAAAESLLNDALSKGTAAVDGDSLANLIVVQQHLQRPIELVNRTISQLTLKSPNHPMISSLQNFDSAFDRVAGVA